MPAILNREEMCEDLKGCLYTRVQFKEKFIFSSHFSYWLIIDSFQISVVLFCLFVLRWGYAPHSVALACFKLMATFLPQLLPSPWGFCCGLQSVGTGPICLCQHRSQCPGLCFLICYHILCSVASPFAHLFWDSGEQGTGRRHRQLEDSMSGWRHGDATTRIRSPRTRLNSITGSRAQGCDCPTMGDVWVWSLGLNLQLECPLCSKSENCPGNG